MRNEACFPCMEDPARCFIVSVPHNQNSSDNSDADPSASSFALSCNRKGELWASSNRGRWEQWCLIPQQHEDSGVFRLVNAAHHTQLTCRYDRETGGILLQATDQNSACHGTSEISTFEDAFEEEKSIGWCLERTQKNSPDVVQLRSFSTNTYLACGNAVEDYGYTSQNPVIYTLSEPTTEQQSTTKAGEDEDDQQPQPQSSAIQSTTLWKLEFLTGELCYIQLAHHTPDNPKLLLCDNFGQVRTSRVWGGWEVWRLVEAGNDRIRISSWTHYTYYLACSLTNGTVTTVTRSNNSTIPPSEDETLWRVRRAPKGLEGVIITSVATGRLLRSDGNSVATTGYLGGVATTWQFTAAHRQRYTISHVGYDKRMSLVLPNSLLNSISHVNTQIHHPTLTTTKYRRDCEVWEIQDMDHGFVALRHEKYKRCLSYDGSGLGVSQEQDPQHWDRSCLWRIVPSPTDDTGAVCFVSAVEPFLALSCNPKGELEAVDHRGPWECWRLEPCMPYSLQGWQINMMIGGAVGAALVGPVLATCLVGGAAVESAAAVAGAAAATEAAEVGLGLAGAAAAVGTGAAVGLSATGLVVVTTNQQRRRAEGTALLRSSEEDQQDRPFCNWKSW